MVAADGDGSRVEAEDRQGRIGRLPIQETARRAAVALLQDDGGVEDEEEKVKVKKEPQEKGEELEKEKDTPHSSAGTTEGGIPVRSADEADRSMEKENLAVRSAASRPAMAKKERLDVDALVQDVERTLFHFGAVARKFDLPSADDARRIYADAVKKMRRPTAAADGAVLDLRPVLPDNLVVDIVERNLFNYAALAKMYRFASADEVRRKYASLVRQAPSSST